MTPDEVQLAVRALLNYFFSSDSTYEAPLDNWITYFESPEGSVGLVATGHGGWGERLRQHFTHDLEDGMDFSGASAGEFQLYERITGETLELFFEEPDDASAGNDALETLLEKMDTVLNTFAVRLAVQGGPLSEYFEAIQYDVTRDGFASIDDSRISDVFHALLLDAELDSVPVDWLAAWEPFMDVFFADYSRGDTNLPVSYGYLVQQMMNAVERAPGGISVEQFAEAFDIPHDLVQGGAGTIEGRNIEDIILVDGDEVLVAGAEGADNYVIGKSFGTTEIFDMDGALDANFDILRFSAHAAADIIATREGINLLLTDAVTGETLTITNQFEGRWPGPTISDASFDYGISEIVFADGTVWSKPDIALAVSRVDNNSTTVTGTEDIDVLQGGLGDDRLEGGGDTDIYRYSFGDGADIILDHEDNNFRHDNDMLQFLGGIGIGDLLFEREGNSGDLLIKLKDHAGDQIKIEGLFEATYTGVYGNWYQKRIEAFTFDDGSSLSFDQLAALVLRTYSTTGDDALYGMNREDVLVAGKGNDYVNGGNEADIYVFNLGDGQDVYQDRVTNILSGTDDTLVFGAGIAAEDIVFERIAGDNNSLVLRIAGTDESVTLLGQYAGVYASVYGNLFFDQIETIRFSGDPETVWTSGQLAQMVLAGEKTAENDTINGFDVNDVLDGGAGDDFLSGGNGDDIYIWGVGFGNDTIQEGGEDTQFGNENDTVVFQGGITADDIAVSRGSGNDVIITIISTGETLTLVNQVWYTSINYHPDQVDKFEFSDGTVWTASDLRQKYLLQSPTDGDDVIRGFYSNDTLDGGAGNDTLYGGDGSDTYIFGYGYGHDIIEEQWSNILYSDDDKVVFDAAVDSTDVTFSRVGNTADLLVMLTSTGETLTVRGEFYTGNFDMNDVESFVFGNGTVVTEDQLRTLLLTSKVGDETIHGFDKSDTFHYVAGGGYDTFIETVNSGSNDKLVFDDLLLSDVTFGRDVNDLLINVSATKGGGSVKLTNSINDYVDQGIEFIQFADGQLLGRAEMRALLVSSTATSGNDTIGGTNSSDVINGGLGDDIMTGGGGNDTYIYVRGDGNDTIHETGINLGTQDKLILNSVDVGAVSFGRSGDNLILQVAESMPGAGDGGQITLLGTGSISYQSGIETIVFDDGTIWDGAAFRARYFEGAYTSGDDTIAGFNTNDTMIGGLGNDVLTGGSGNDTYNYVRGDGHDTIDEAGGVLWGTADKIDLLGVLPSDISLIRNGNDATLVIAESASGVGDAGSILIKSAVQNNNQAGIEQIMFADGTIWTPFVLRDMLIAVMTTSGNDRIEGFGYSETIDGGEGDDELIGGGGNDIYNYTRGDGRDIISETGVLWGNADKLVLMDIASTEVDFYRSAGDINIVIHPSTPGGPDGGMITIQNGLYTNNQVGVEQIQFSDGVTLTPSDLSNMITHFGSGSGNDTVTGTTSADTFLAGIGNDTMLGLAGSDTYIYALGDGSDYIVDASGSIADIDVLRFTDLNATDVTFSRTDNHAQITVNADGQVIALHDQFYSATANRGIDRIEFADGEIWTRAAIFEEAWVRGTAGADTLGTASLPFKISNVIIDMGLGNDTIYGDRVVGNTMVYRSGDGYEQYRLWNTSATTNIVKLLDLIADDIALGRNGNDLLILDKGTGQAITVTDHFTSNKYGLQKLSFSDGSGWDRAAISTNVSFIGGTEGNDSVAGTSGNDTLFGGLGDDALNGGGGNDTYFYAVGHGNDTIMDGASDTLDVLKFVDLGASDVSLSRDGVHLLIDIIGTSDTIIIDEQFFDEAEYWGIERIDFSDGSSLDRSQILDTVSLQ